MKIIDQVIMDQATLDNWTKKDGPVTLRVSEVSRMITRLLEDPSLQNIWIIGEITNFKRHSSGHLYFSLSEQIAGKESVVSCAIWKSAARYLDFTPDDGMEVRAYGSISHYEPGGRYSFQITQMRPSGAGERALLIEGWRREMAAKGWFSPDRKRIPPRYPVRIGVVTSSTGAVIHDIRNVISKRFPAEIILSPTMVQGASAHEEIARAIIRVQDMVDVIIVGRGGGSYEDLFAFNHPCVVEAIVTCPVPVIAAIGHEVDITLADLAADVSASTPSHAAEQCVPDRESELDALIHMRKRMFLQLMNRLESAQEDLNGIRDRLSSPRLLREVRMRQEALADLTDRMERGAQGLKDRAQSRLAELRGRLEGRNPLVYLRRELPERKNFLAEIKGRLSCAVQVRLQAERAELTSLSAILKARGPEALFQAGYCMVSSAGTVIRSCTELTPGKMVTIRLRDGTADAAITQVYHDKKV
ncbi:Exodeoxyribonuclease VII large subunit [Methanospirillum hungatei JF-1]|jgi:exodeoxyribonuclease VII large subunit|uniref:Exodeoxyribonuclease VII large subunit n=1 Tax=Methanospirillum hungatei JF-1 (strain ATCC 27890 / DSM 864 / NBRC 100397 / JF-1) TaxID=323259 RepID=Q2FTK2_METHJ|nr:exodeoxyribonuclease VII large subunit [Methanospirillum hungatei]ABD42696.1 Exodeoxyribonuclease VII large subunit [Methanospirillum hungatei JF-1]